MRKTVSSSCSRQRYLTIDFTEVNDSLRHIFVFPAQAGIHFSHGHRLEFILGPAQGRTRGPVWRDF